MYPIGVTIGKRFYYDNKKWHLYNYLDAQLSFGLLGFGTGIINNNTERYYRFQSWIGFWGLLSYDYIN